MEIRIRNIKPRGDLFKREFTKLANAFNCQFEFIENERTCDKCYLKNSKGKIREYKEECARLRDLNALLCEEMFRLRKFIKNIANKASKL